MRSLRDKRRTRVPEVSSIDHPWALEADEVARESGSSRDGLSEDEAARRRRRETPPHHHRTELVLLLRQFSTPITLLLIGATILSAILGELTDAIIILAIVLASGLLSFWQEHRASRAMRDLQASVAVLVEVRRDGRTAHVHTSEIVPGDVVLVDTGDLIPGDCRIFEARSLLVDEATLTGESYPVEKTTTVLPPDTPVARRSNCLFRGTHVVRGSAEAIVTAVGESTELGHIASRLEERVPTTSFERGISSFGALLVRVMAVLVVLIFAFNAIAGRSLIDSLLFALALAVGLTPQMLPAIVSISLALGAKQMAKHKVIVKRLNAIEDAGGMDILCTDKTGTLTTGIVTLDAMLAPDGAPSARRRARRLPQRALPVGLHEPDRRRDHCRRPGGRGRRPLHRRDPVRLRPGGVRACSSRRTGRLV